jgi:(p)ppGpp synthase/HD superfamily hydrolase
MKKQPGPVVQLGPDLVRAVAYALETHHDHVRKGTSVPYISHLLQVAGLVLECGGTEEEAIAGLLHDAAEDRGGEERLVDIEREFGSNVAGIVRENSDSLTEQKGPWQERKNDYVAGIAHKSESALLVSMCDKIHNLRSLTRDTRQEGDPHWERFTGKKVGSMWYYEALRKAFATRVEAYPRLEQAFREMSHATDELLRACGG